MKKGVLWIGIGVGMVVFDLLVEPIFSIPITSGFRFPLAILAVLYGVLAIVSARMTESMAQLTPAELNTWGDKLSQATPRIIALSEQQMSSDAIAKTVEKETQIPQDILMKYMYAMRNYLKDAAKQANEAQSGNQG